MEGDQKLSMYGNGVNISIHSLRMEGDYEILVEFYEQYTFQSTPSAWRETKYL